MERVPWCCAVLPVVHPYMVLEDIFHSLYQGIGKEQVVSIVEGIKLPNKWALLHKELNN
jgi:hypothetical protein